MLPVLSKGFIGSVNVGSVVCDMFVNAVVSTVGATGFCVSTKIKFITHQFSSHNAIRIMQFV